MHRARTTPLGPDARLDARRFDGTYTDPTGSLDYTVHVAATLRKRPPLLVMLHGASQTAADFATGTRMPELLEDCGGIALFPQQSRRAHPLGCWNWYDTRHQFADSGEPAMIVGLTRQIIAAHGVDPRRVYVAGMSAGGAMAVILGQAYPDVYAAVGVHSGIPTGVAHDLGSALRTMNSGPPGRASAAGLPVNPRSCSIPTIIFHGDRDQTVHPLNAEAVLAQALRRADDAGASRSAAPGPTRMPGGRDVTRSMHARDKEQAAAELWIVHGAGHAWTGGSPEGSFTDESGPDASREMLRFFLAQSQDRDRRGSRA